MYEIELYVSPDFDLSLLEEFNYRKEQPRVYWVTVKTLDEYKTLMDIVTNAAEYEVYRFDQLIISVYGNGFDE